MKAIVKFWEGMHLLQCPDCGKIWEIPPPDVVAIKCRVCGVYREVPDARERLQANDVREKPKP